MRPTFLKGYEYPAMVATMATTILKDQSEVRVLFISGYAPGVLDIQIIVGSGLEFLRKSFKPEVFLRRVREVLNRAGQ